MPLYEVETDAHIMITWADADDAASPEAIAIDRADGRKRAGWIKAALRRLSPRERKIIVSRFLTETPNTLAELGTVCREAGVLMHTDAAQSFGKVPLDVQDMALDLISLSGHKIYGPKGVGALYVRRRKPRIRITAFQEGGGQERGLSPGTLNVPGIVGLGAACRWARE